MSSENPSMMRFWNNAVEFARGHDVAHIEVSDGNFIAIR